MSKILNSTALFTHWIFDNKFRGKRRISRRWKQPCWKHVTNSMFYGLIFSVLIALKHIFAMEFYSLSYVKHLNSIMHTKIECFANKRSMHWICKGLFGFSLVNCLHKYRCTYIQYDFQWICTFDEVLTDFPIQETNEKANKIYTIYSRNWKVSLAL